MQLKQNILFEKYRPCVYRDEYICGENIFIFYSKLSLTKRSEWEKLVIQQMKKLNFKSEEHHEIAINSLEVVLPSVVLISFVLLMGRFKK